MRHTIFALILLVAACSSAPSDSASSDMMDDVDDRNDATQSGRDAEHLDRDGDIDPEARELSPFLLQPVATGTTAPVFLSLRWVVYGDIQTGGWSPIEAVSSTPAVLRVDEFLSPNDTDDELFEPHIRAEALEAGSADLDISVSTDEGETLESSLEVLVHDPAEFRVIEACSTDTIAPGGRHTFEYEIRDADGQQLFGDVAKVLMIEQSAPADPMYAARLAGSDFEGLSITPAYGTTTIRWEDLGASHELTFLRAEELDELQTAEVDKGERGPGEFGTANVVFRVFSDGTEVCVEDPDAIEWAIAEGAECVAFPQPHTDDPLAWRVENKGDSPCLIDFFLRDSAAQAVRLEIP